MMLESGVRVEAPTASPEGWRVYVPVGHVTLTFAIVPGEGLRCVGRSRAGRGTTAVPRERFLAAVREAGRRFAELRARQKNAPSESDAA